MLAKSKMREMGLYLDIQVLFPVFKIGIALAILRDTGHIDFAIPILKMCSTGLSYNRARDFKVLELIGFAIPASFFSSFRIL